MEIKTISTIDYDELDKMVNELFPKSNFEFVADNEANNYSAYPFNDVKKEDFLRNMFPKAEFDDLDYRVTKNNFTEFLQRISGEKNFLYHVYDMIQYLVFIGKLPEGNILVEVSW